MAMPSAVGQDSLEERGAAGLVGSLLNFVALAMHLIPKNLVSYLTGFVVRVRLPGALGLTLCRGFATLFRIDMSEAEFPLAAYPTIEDLFTRRLRSGCRPVASPICSPADGRLARSEPSSDDLAIQAKGHSYRLLDLVFGTSDSEAAARAAFRPAWYHTIYLAPHNYHRVHAPFDGEVTVIRYVPGELWPVNVPFVQRIPRLFVRNERLVFECLIEGGGRAAVVMVGALNVGRIVTPLSPSLVSNGTQRQWSRLEDLAAPCRKLVRAGDELGTFMLGSTVVIVYDEEARRRFNFGREATNRPILMGEGLLPRPN